MRVSVTKEDEITTFVIAVAHRHNSMSPSPSRLLALDEVAEAAAKAAAAAVVAALAELSPSPSRLLPLEVAAKAAAAAVVAALAEISPSPLRLLPLEAVAEKAAAAALVEISPSSSLPAACAARPTVLSECDGSGGDEEYNFQRRDIRARWVARRRRDNRFHRPRAAHLLRRGHVDQEEDGGDAGVDRPRRRHLKSQFDRRPRSGRPRRCGRNMGKRYRRFIGNSRPLDLLEAACGEHGFDDGEDDVEDAYESREEEEGSKVTTYKEYQKMLEEKERAAQAAQGTAGT